MAAAATSDSKNTTLLHAVIFPYMAQGHTRPLLDISKALSKRPGVQVTIISTPSNAQQISSTLNHHQYPNISIHVIPFPYDCENTDHLTSRAQLIPFLKATLKLKHPFETFLREQLLAAAAGGGSVNPTPICVIADMFLGWALGVSRSVDSNIQTLLFNGMGVLPSVISRVGFFHAGLIINSTDDDDDLVLPGLEGCPFALTRSDFPEIVAAPNEMNSLFEFMVGVTPETDEYIGGILVNSFEELEGDYMALLESTYEEGVKSWCVGPTLLYDVDRLPPPEEDYALDWLDQQLQHKGSGTGSVVYVSFGTQAYLTDTQLDEISLGLQMAGHPFLWVVRSETWRRERVEGKGSPGLVVRGWVDQRRVLGHPAVGGFFSHCGWNSMLESVAAGVPVLAWPMAAEQPLNAKLVVEVLGAGVRIIGTKQQQLQGTAERGSIVGSEEICDGVKELMDGENGKRAKERAEEVGRMAARAVEEGGSSSRNLDRLVECLIDSQINRQQKIRSTF